MFSRSDPLPMCFKIGYHRSEIVDSQPLAFTLCFIPFTIETIAFPAVLLFYCISFVLGRAQCLLFLQLETSPRHILLLAVIPKKIRLILQFLSHSVNRKSADR